MMNRLASLLRDYKYPAILFWLLVPVYGFFLVLTASVPSALVGTTWTVLGLFVWYAFKKLLESVLEAFMAKKALTGEERAFAGVLGHLCMWSFFFVFLPSHIFISLLEAVCLVLAVVFWAAMAVKLFYGK